MVNNLLNTNIIACITHFKVHGETGNAQYSGQYPHHGANPILRVLHHNALYYDIELTGSKPQGETYTKEFTFSHHNCVTREDKKFSLEQVIMATMDGTLPQLTLILPLKTVIRVISTIC